MLTNKGEAETIQNMKIIFCQLAIFFILPSVVFSADNKGAAVDKKSAIIKSINGIVDVLDKKISKDEFPTLKVEYDFHDATEGVPPSFKFYFDNKKAGNDEKSILRVCKIHVGHEVYSNDYIYYFDEEGRPLKYLELNSGFSGEYTVQASREGIIYDKKGQVIWSSIALKLRLSFKEIQDIFSNSEKSLGKF